MNRQKLKKVKTLRVKQQEMVDILNASQLFKPLEITHVRAQENMRFETIAFILIAKE